MASQPAYSATPIAGGQSVTNVAAETSYTAPTTAVTLLSAAAIAVSSVTTTSGSPLVTVATGNQFSASVGPIGAQVQPWVNGMTLMPCTQFPNGANVLAVFNQASGGSSALLSVNASATSAGAATLTAVSNGIRIEEVHFVATGTTLAGQVQTYLYDGTHYHPHWNQLIPSGITPGTTQVPYLNAVQFDNLELPSGWSYVAASFTASQPIFVNAYGGSI